jgi:hypothetical protein
VLALAAAAMGGDGWTPGEEEMWRGELAAPGGR